MEAGKRSAWMVHVKKTIKQHRGMQLKDVLKLAKKTYKGGQLQGKMGPMGGRRHRSRRGGQPGTPIAPVFRGTTEDFQPITLDEYRRAHEEPRSEESGSITPERERPLSKADSGLPTSKPSDAKQGGYRKHRGGQPNDDMASLENAPLPPTLERQNAQYEEDTGVPPSAIGGRKHRRSRKHRGGQLYSFAGGPYTDSVLADGAAPFKTLPDATWQGPSELKGGRRRRHTKRHRRH